MKIIKVTFVALLMTITACSQNTKTKTTSKEPDYSKVDYSARSNIIKRPKELKGDEKKIFYHDYFLKLTSKQAKSLTPFQIKTEFAKLGILTNDEDRFINAWDFFDLNIIFHKKSCENWEYFKDLEPSNN